MANDRLFAVLAEALGKPELADDPRFATDADRSDNDEALRSEIEGVSASRTVEQMCTLLDAAGVPASPVWNLADALTSDLGAERDLHARDPRLGHGFIAHPLLVDGTRAASDLPVPQLGEHNDTLTAANPTDEE